MCRWVSEVRAGRVRIDSNNDPAGDELLPLVFGRRTFQGSHLLPLIDVGGQYGTLKSRLQHAATNAPSLFWKTAASGCVGQTVGAEARGRTSGALGCFPALPRPRSYAGDSFRSWLRPRQREIAPSPLAVK